MLLLELGKLTAIYNKISMLSITQTGVDQTIDHLDYCHWPIWTVDSIPTEQVELSRPEKYAQVKLDHLRFLEVKI